MKEGMKGGKKGGTTHQGQRRQVEAMQGKKEKGRKGRRGEKEDGVERSEVE